MTGAAHVAGAPITPIGWLIGFVLIPVLPWLIGMILGIAAIHVSAYLYTEYLWYQSVGYVAVFVKLLATQAALFVATFGVAFILLAGNLHLSMRLSPMGGTLWRSAGWAEPIRKLLSPIAGRLFNAIGMFAGLIAAIFSLDYWEAALLWTGRGEWGRTDPYFDLDLGYFMFELPFHLFVHRYLLVLCVIALCLTVLAGLVFGALRVVYAGSRAAYGARVQMITLMLFIVGLIGWGLRLELHVLSYSELGVVTGLGYTDANAALLAIKLTAGALIIGFVLCSLSLYVPIFVIPAMALGSVFLVALAAVKAYPGFYQRFVVEPDELTLERPYIEDHIAFTRYGYGLEDVDRIALSGRPAMPADAELSWSRLRLWDPGTLRITLDGLQSLKGYYDVGDVDADRYTVNGEVRPVMVAARNRALRGLPAEGRRWQADHLVYTNGFGLVAADAAMIGGGGLPVLHAKNMPVEGAADFRRAAPQLYYGEGFTDYALVGTKTPELRTPQDDPGFADAPYEGTGGIAADDLFTRIAFAIRYWEPRLALTSQTTTATKILLHQDVRRRAKRLSPFLEIGRDPYPVAVDGRTLWLIDVYTSSDMMPYSRRVNLDTFATITSPRGGSGFIPGTAPARGKPLHGASNYIRGSVKAVIDAEHGTVDFYAVGADPLLDAWKRVLPEVFKPNAAVSADLRAHFRYPQDVFRMQTALWATYHMDDPDSFYARESAWRVPPDASFISRRRERVEPFDERRDLDLRPVWLFTRFPGQNKDTFGVVHPYTPAGQDVLAGYLVGHSDGDRYGTLTSYSFPQTQFVPGPAQAQARIDQDPYVSGWTTLRMQSGSRVSRGRILLVPSEQGVAYVLPLFVQADESPVQTLKGATLASLPELKKVVVLLGDRVVMEDTLEEAIGALRTMEEETES